MIPTPDRITDVLAPLDPTVVAVLEAQPGWVWARCEQCLECRLQRRAPDLGKCVLTPGCRARMAIYLETACLVCGRPVSIRRRGSNIEFCTKRCEKGAAA